MRAFEITWGAIPEHIVFQAGGPIPVDDLGDGWFRVHYAPGIVFTSPDDSSVPWAAVVREDGAVRVRGSDLEKSDDGMAVRIRTQR
ncbi:MAG: hypothetical protein RLO52_23210 [Sandaracinaceae bacterium]